MDDNQTKAQRLSLDGKRVLQYLVVLVGVVLLIVLSLVIKDGMHTDMRVHEGKTGKWLAREILQAYKLQLGEYKIDCGHYPTTQQGLSVLAEPSDKDDCANRKEFYTEKMLDPWGRENVYTSDGNTFTIMSLGADGKPGGEGDDADIVEKSPTEP